MFGTLILPEMASLIDTKQADSKHLKRSFAQVAGLKSSSIQGARWDLCANMSVQALSEPSNPSCISYSKRRSHSLSRSDMPAHSPQSPSFSSSFPSLASRFGAGSHNFAYGDGKESCLRTNIISSTGTAAVKGTGTGANEAVSSYNTVSTSSQQLDLPAYTNGSLSGGACAVPVELLPRNSISSTTSESTNSSPTTTISTFDSPTVTETSPSSSPESPSVAPLPSFKPMSQDTNIERPPSQLPKANLALSTQNQPESPTRRARNLKNLSLRLPTTSASRPSVATAPFAETTRHVSAPSSPVHPITKGTRRRPPNLTIQTPGLDRAFTSNIAEVVPPTPGTRSALRHIESSPSLHSVLSPTVGPKSSLRPFFPPNKRSIPGAWDDGISPNPSEGSNQGSFSTRETLQELDEEDGPMSRESRRGSERGYPDGPICIYDSGLYLYLEPTRKEACDFDVVFNVAKEVNNPFRTDESKNDTVMSIWKAALPDSKCQSEPDTAMSDVSFKSAFEYLSSQSESPTTPKAENSQPEYIHVPWDHNSEILEDLYPLCEMIDDRISKGKKVLIHCQLGVSRSASLVIAYGLFKNPDLDFNAMYDIVKERSCWVGPNMSLIYQLTDFRSRVRQGGPTKTPPTQWFSEASQAAAKPAGLATVSGRIEGSKSRPPVPLFNQPPKETPSLQSPTSFSNPFAPAPQPQSILRPLPLREKYQTVGASSRRTAQLDGVTKSRHFTRPSVQMDLVMQDVPPSPSVLSPNSAKFWMEPFSRTVAGDLAMHDSIMSPTGNPGLFTADAEDPRSPHPHTRREPLIMRNIDEFL